MRYNKLSIITSVIVATSLLATSAFAQRHYKDYYKDEVTPPPCHHVLYLDDGFYMGIQGGYDAYRVRTTSNYVSPAFGPIPAGTFAASANPIISSNGFVGGLFGGYGIVWGDFYYTGIEGFVNGSNAYQSQTFTATLNGAGTVTNTTKVYADFSYGGSVLPGLKVNDSTLLYGRIGYTEAKLRGQSAVTLAPPGIGAVSFLANDKQWTGGINYGVGIETTFYPKLSVRSEYVHTDFHPFSDPNRTKYSESDNQLLVSLIYHFFT